MMQVFLGDEVTLMKSNDGEVVCLVTGQVSGVVLDDSKRLERVWVHGIENSFWMSQGWQFIEEEDDGEI
jgi:hypothetical protein